MSRTIAGLCATAALGLALPAAAPAAKIAVFGDNQTDNFLTSQGHTATLVSDAQLATPGFLSGFDAFVFTRPGLSFGTGLSAGAAAQVVSHAKRVVALNGDFADSLPGSEAPDPQAQQIVANAANWAAVGSGGVIGEFNGAVSLLGSNASGLRPLGLLTGSAGPLFGPSSQFGAIDATAAGTAHPVLASVALPDNPAGNDFGAQISGADAAQVLARYTSNGNPAILARIVNSTPDCSQLTAGPDVLWPANHKLRTVTVGGGSDPDGDPITHRVTAVTQDEAVNAAGEGSTGPDAVLGPNADQAQVRGERAGGGDGRVYRLAVTVTDDKGATCTGHATVGVPHDQAGAPAVDSGQQYDSLTP